MANHAHILSDKEVDRDVLKALLDEVNEERFGGLLTISEPHHGYFLALIDPYNSLIEIWVRDPEDNIPLEEGEEYYPNDAKVEIRHGHALKCSWYTDLFISHWITEKLEGQIADEADGELVDAYFHTKYPRLRDYNKGNFYSFPWTLILRLMRSEKRACGKELWNLL